MNMKLINIFFFISLTVTKSFGQIENYDYKKVIKKGEQGWHEIILTPEIFEKLNQDLYDLRIYGINTEGDTIEAPYILEVYEDKIESISVETTIINRNFNSTTSSFIVEIPAQRPVNRLELGFGIDNYDWKIRLEGSHDLQNWSTIVDEYRILSIKNEHTEYRYNTIHFTNSKYRYFRISLPVTPLPDLRNVRIKAVSTFPGKKEWIKGSLKIDNNDEYNRTEVLVNLEHRLPYQGLQIHTPVSYDFYRSMHVTYLSDSTKTEKGWVHNYKNKITDVFSSMDNRSFDFSRALGSTFKIFIYNRDNAPVPIDSVEGFYYKHVLKVRFNEPAEYYLYYGNPLSRRPDYDVSRFIDLIPDSLTVVSLGPEIPIHSEEPSKDHTWSWQHIGMWALIITLILLIGGLTIRMLQREPI